MFILYQTFFSCHENHTGWGFCSQKNCYGSTISERERSCDALVSKPEYHISVRSWYFTGLSTPPPPPPTPPFPPRLQILRIVRELVEGIMDDIIANDTWRHLCKKYSLTPITTNLRWYKTREKDVVGIVTFDLTGLLPTKLLWHTGVYERTFNVNSTDNAK